MTTIGAIVVHHANYPTVLRTVDHIVGQGIPPGQLVVVDNSEDDSLADELRRALPSATMLEVIRNDGYGQAVNVGVSRLLKVNPLFDYIVVSSHETVPAPGAIAALEYALKTDPELGVVGPTLVSDGQVAGLQVYWSCGGALSRFLNEPRHIGYMSPLGTMPAVGPVVQREWLDGAFCLYRAAILTKLQFRSEFFLYFEETELHVRMRKAGHKVGWVPSAYVAQGSDGIPPFLLGRNLQLFQQMHGTRIQQLCTVPAVIMRRAARRLLGRGRSGEVGKIIRGWISALR
jgi:GT2 family glycosyltransferase